MSRVKKENSDGPLTGGGLTELNNLPMNTIKKESLF